MSVIGASSGVLARAADVVVTGDVRASVDLHIDGRVEGDVTCASLVQGTGSHIIGSVSADNARLAGAIEGAIRVKTLVIEQSARISAEAYLGYPEAERYLPHDGCVYRDTGNPIEPPPDIRPAAAEARADGGAAAAQRGGYFNQPLRRK